MDVLYGLRGRDFSERVTRDHFSNSDIPLPLSRADVLLGRGFVVYRERL